MVIGFSGFVKSRLLCEIKSRQYCVFGMKVAFLTAHNVTACCMCLHDRLIRFVQTLNAITTDAETVTAVVSVLDKSCMTFLQTDLAAV